MPSANSRRARCDVAQPCNPATASAEAAGLELGQELGLDAVAQGRRGREGAGRGGWNLAEVGLLSHATPCLRVHAACDSHTWFLSQFAMREAHAIGCCVADLCMSSLCITCIVSDLIAQRTGADCVCLADLHTTESIVYQKWWILQWMKDTVKCLRGSTQ